MNNKQSYRAGTDTGSLTNLLMSGSKDAEPKVGMGATILMWSDRHAATVVSVEKDGRRVGIVQDNTERKLAVGEHVMSDSQEYDYSPGTGSVQYYTLRKNGAFVREGDNLKGQRIMLGEREEYHDFSF